MASTSQPPEIAGSCQNDVRQARLEKASTIPKETWEKYKAAVYEEYIVKKCSFAELMKFMEDNHDFTASDSQYRTVLREWKFFKNRKGAKRAGNPEEEQTREKRPCPAPENGDPEYQASSQNPPPHQSETAQNINTSVPLPSLNGAQYSNIGFSLTENLDADKTLDPSSFEDLFLQPQDLGPPAAYNFNPMGPFNGFPLVNPYPFATGSCDTVQIARNWQQQYPAQAPNFDPRLRSGYNKTSVPPAPAQLNIFNTGEPTSRPSMRNHSNGNGTRTNTSTKIQPIHHAAQAGSLENVKFLLEVAPACADMLGTDGVSAMWIAAQQGHTKIVKLLISEYKVALNTAVTDSKRTPIHQAAQGGHIDVVKLLLDSGAEADPRDHGNVTPLWSAAQQGYTKIVKMLLDEGADQDVTSKDGSRRPIHQAAQNGHSDVVEMLLLHKAKADPIDNNDITPLWSAAQQGHDRIVKMLLENGADTEVTSDDGSRRPIHQAAQNGHLETVKILLEYHAQANPEKDSFGDKVPSPLWLAAQKGSVGIAKLLLEDGADANFSISPSRRRPLHQATQEGNTELVRLLIEHGAEVDAGEEDGWPPMMLAAQQGHIEIVDLLVEKGANINSEEKDGATSLWMASQQGHAEIVKKLLLRGARTFATKTNLRQPIHQAAQNGHLEVVKLLVKHDGGSVHVKDKKGSTPLCLASQGKGAGRLIIMKYLYSKGAKVIED